VGCSNVLEGGGGGWEEGLNTLQTAIMEAAAAAVCVSCNTRTVKATCLQFDCSTYVLACLCAR
jgi:hypothetical protein